MANEKTSTKVSSPNSDSSVTDKGSGFQLVAGYGFEIGKSFHIGPALVYRNVTLSAMSFVLINTSFS